MVHADTDGGVMCLANLDEGDEFLLNLLQFLGIFLIGVFQMLEGASWVDIVARIDTHLFITFDNGATLTKAAFSKIPVVGTPLLTFGLLTFAFSTILGWCYYGERAVEYLKGKKWVVGYRVIYIVAVFLGSVMNLALVWNMADCMNALMAIPNLISILALSGVIIHETRKYLWRNRLEMEM